MQEFDINTCLQDDDSFENTNFEIEIELHINRIHYLNILNSIIT